MICERERNVLRDINYFDKYEAGFTASVKRTAAQLKAQLDDTEHAMEVAHHKRCTTQ